MGDPYSVVFQPGCCHLRIPIRTLLVIGKQKDSPNSVLPTIQIPKELPQNVFPTRSQQVGVRTKFCSRRTTGSSMFDHDFRHLWCARRIHTYGLSDLANPSNFGASSYFTGVQADTASAACPAHPEKLPGCAYTKVKMEDAPTVF